MAERNRSHNTALPAPRAGLINSCINCARLAMNNNNSQVRANCPYLPERIISRMHSPAGVPPGSRVFSIGSLPTRYCSSMYNCVLLPQPSRPSKTINLPSSFWATDGPLPPGLSFVLRGVLIAVLWFLTLNYATVMSISTSQVRPCPGQLGCYNGCRA